MSNEQQVDYLANVIGLARADGKITRQETEAIELVQKAIGARKTELNRAYKNAESDAFIPRVVGSWSDQIKNLEHIIYIALIDGAIEGDEKQYVINFAKQVKISQDQLTLIIKDAKRTISNASQDVTCTKCNARISVSAKFCPECGQSVETSLSTQPVAVSYEIPESGVAIEFAESTGAGFALAVQSSMKAPISKECVKGKKRWFLGAWPKSEIADALDLVEHLKGLRNRKVYLDGKETQWNDVFGFSWCASNRNSAYRPNEYCFGIDEKRLNIWGCKQARMEWSDWGDWFGYGSFRKSGVLSKTVVFEFDKNRIRHEIETNLHNCRLCPHLQFDLIEAVLDTLPNEVSPSEKGAWQYKRDYSESPGAIFVKETVKDGAYTYTNEYYSSGVRPASVYVGLDILKKALLQCNMPTDFAKDVLEYKE
ncbi:zinc-ribbon domain-containing protein [Methylotuvimicrobium sp. KM2]|uniref:zinc-ribbon domain-containing protein n=1 Tax=Methylotuvimicrobium sp. KM2 TaxID=3133976 RepID=UPI003101338B